MAELAVSMDETPGIMKEIDGGAFELMFQAIQEDIYSYPIKSFVRESISNGLDALVEKENYIAIKNGDPVEKYYRQLQDGKLLKDSDFQPEYYTDRFLNSISKVFVSYEKLSNTRKHRIVIKDTGVGLGGTRLQGFFKIGYSTKRNLKNVFGKWGSGAKAGLATGEDYFIMTTVYNGYKTSFMIFKTDYEGITPTHPQGKKEAWKVRSINGDEVVRTIHWAPTNELNSVSISLEVKPHNENAFKSAVENQFEHFEGRVEFSYQDEEGKKVINKLDEKPLFESNTILIPSNPSYSSPVILVDKISYGTISWEELELERRPGAMSIKVHATDVDITQSRESLKWTEKTKKLILKAIKNAEEEATEHISKKLELEDKHNLFELNTRYSDISVTSSSDIVSRSFSKFLNRRTLIPKYEFNPEWFGKKFSTKLNAELFDVMFYSYTVKIMSMDVAGSKVKTKFRRVTCWEDIADMSIVHSASAPLGPKLANHLLQYELTEDSFVYIRVKTTEGKPMQKIGNLTIPTQDIDTYTSHLLKAYGAIDLDEYEYDEVIDESDDARDGIEVEVDRATLAQIRKRNEEVLYRSRTYGYPLKKHIVKIANIKREVANTGRKTVFATADFNQFGSFLEAFGNEFLIDVFYVAKDVLADFIPYGTFVTDYIRHYKKETKELIICPEIQTYNTILKAEEIAKKYPGWFYDGKLMSDYDPYFEDNWYQNGTSFSYTDEFEIYEIKSFIEKLNKAQDLLEKKELTSAISKELFNVDEIAILNSYDREYIQRLEKIMEEFTTLEPILRLVDNTSIQEDQLRIFKHLINNNTLNKLQNVSI